MILFYGRTCQIMKSLFSLEFYAAFYKGLTTHIITCPDYPRCNFNRERVYIYTTFNILRYNYIGYKNVNYTSSYLKLIICYI